MQVMEFSSLVAVNPLEVCDFSGLRCGASLVCFSAKTSDMGSGVCQQRSGVGSMLGPVLPPLVAIESRGYLMRTENLQISLLLFFESPHAEAV